MILDLDILDTVQSEVLISEPLPESISGDASDLQILDEPTATNSVDSTPANVPAAETSIEWYSMLEAVVDDVNAEVGEPPSMSPRLDELRRVAKIQFAPVVDSSPRPIWENVEKDQMGRTVLRAGDCYRVLDDWRVTNQWEQENFGQYFVYCEFYKSPPKELPFVAQIIERYDYLNDR